MDQQRFKNQSGQMHPYTLLNTSPFLPESVEIPSFILY